MFCFHPQAWEDYLYWQKNDKTVLKRINQLLKDIERNPDDHHGIGKPERLKGDLSGYISRRITEEHRLVYKVSGEKIIIVQCRFHYR
jgi:toxin YoeB